MGGDRRLSLTSQLSADLGLYHQHCLENWRLFISKTHPEKHLHVQQTRGTHHATVWLSSRTL